MHKILIYNLIKNKICMPESFNMNISYQLFGYKITFVYSHHKNTNPKGYFVLNKRFETLILNISGKQKIKTNLSKNID